MKKNIKRMISAVIAVSVVAVLAAMPLIARNEAEEDGPKASILSGTVETGSIDTVLLGGGTLAEEDAVTVDIPAAVKLKKFLVSNGDTVSKGDAIASVDRVTVMTAIAQVQETLEKLSEEIQAEGEKDTDGSVTALAGGTVKILYAEAGKSVQEVMLAHGSLAVLSLDGLMAVDLTLENAPAVGEAITVTLSDGTKTTGKVAASLAGDVTITLEDDSYPVGDQVQVTNSEGADLGTAELYIYSPWNATAYAGTISSVKVTEGKTVKAGATLMTLTDVGYTAAYRQLVAQRQAYEELMLELFSMYQTELITAPADGVVSGIDQESLQLLSAGHSFTLSFLSNAPNGNDEVSYTNFIAQVLAVEDTGWTLMVDPAPLAVTDYADLTGVTADPMAMTQEAFFDPQIPVYAMVNGQWDQVETAAVQPGDQLLLAFAEIGSAVWAVLIQEKEIPSDPTQPGEPENPTEPSEPGIPDSPTEPDIPGDPTTPTEPGGSGQPSNPDVPSGGDFPSSGGNFPSSGGSFGNMGGMSGSISGSISGGFPQMEQEPSYELYSLDMAAIAAVTPQGTMTLEITVDELDISALKSGMSAQVKINALGGEKVAATITGIGNTGTSNGGSSKFTVELTMERGEHMLAGMNANASIVLDTTRDTPTLPAEALVEQGTQTVVYTGYDVENDVLTDPVAVRTGISDGQTVQILDGLNAGDTYYYAYYDTLEISITPDFGGGGFIFG